MEVSGKLSQDISTAVDTTLDCLPCNRDGLNEPAYGFCQDCQEHLCETCYKHHRRARPLRNHVLLDKDSMPKTLVPLKSADTADHCDKHDDKLLEFYCRDHDSVACYVCVTLEHNHCKVDYIPDVSSNMSDELTDILAQMETLMEKCKSNLIDIEKAAQNLDESRAKVAEDIKEFRKEIDKCLDKMEAKIKMEANAFVKNAKCKQETIKASCLEINEELGCSHSLLCTLGEENKQNKLFIAMKNVGKRLSTLKDTEKQVLDANTTDDCVQFTANKNLIHGLMSENTYGTLITSAKPSLHKAVDLQYTDTINVNSKSDEFTCHITGIAMIAPTKIIVADYTNLSIKLIDIEKKSVVKAIKMSSQVSDIITFPGNKLAGTLASEKSIQIMSFTDTELSLAQRLSVGERCNGIAYCNNKFVVCCGSSRKLIIISVKGEVLNILYKPDLFSGPTRVVISNDELFLYVLDTDFKQKNMIMQIDWDGNVMNSFEEQGFVAPFGLQQLEDDTILVCSINKLMRLSDKLKECRLMGLKEGELFHIHAVTYCDIQHKLFVSCSSKHRSWQADIIKVFNVKWV